MDGFEVLDLVKRRTITAFARDPILSQYLVLKGGNALALAYEMSNRPSFDVDFSITGDFKDVDSIARQIPAALDKSFREVGLTPFDVKFFDQPDRVSADLAPFWGGYCIQFKVLESSEFERLRAAGSPMSRRALALGGFHAPSTYEVEISKHEYCGDTRVVQLDDCSVRVYSPSSVLCEKLRALCQQLPAYDIVVKRKSRNRGRARDFVDISSILDRTRITPVMPTVRELLSRVFEAKRVDLRLLEQLDGTRDIHFTDFPSVVSTAPPDSLNDFDVYFNRVMEFRDGLELFWNK